MKASDKGKILDATVVNEQKKQAEIAEEQFKTSSIV
jgi:hypothetical protein